MSGSPVRYTPDLETVRPDESQTVEGLKQAFDTILETTSQDYGHAVRSVHAKAHGILQGTLTVHEGLPPELAQGLFARPGRHKAYVRLSTNAGDILPDAIGLPRGIAIKVLEVEGERIDGAEGSTQDFVMVNGRVFQAKTADQFLKSLKLLAATTDRMEGAKKAASAVLRGINTALGAVGIESTTVASLGGAPNVDPLGETYTSVTPFRFGDHVAKFGLAPASPSFTALAGSTIDAAGRPDAIRETVRAEMKGLGGAWDFRVQLCLDPDKQPVEDPTVEWKEDDTPFRTVATLSVDAQDSWAPEMVERVDEAMRFSVWTGLEAHRPLGNINRARRDTYRHSAEYRARFNRCPIHEPAE